MYGIARHRGQSGFTLFELLIVMGIVGILAAIAIPSFKYVTTSNRIAGEINGLLGDLQYARSEAVKEGLPVTVCIPTSDYLHCATSAANWQSGWIVFSDANNNHVVDGSDFIIRQQNVFTQAFSSTDTLVPDAAAFKWLTFNREGFATTGLAATVTMKLNDSTNNVAWKRCLAITPVGGISTQKDGQGNC